MDDANIPGGPLSPEGPAAKLGLYLETLQATMKPEEYDAVCAGLRQFWRVMESGGEGSFTMDTQDFNDVVRKEFIMAVAIIGTGRMDYEVVEVAGTDGSPGWAVVDADIATDPNTFADLRQRFAAWDRERQAVDEALEGIEEASNEQNGR